NEARKCCNHWRKSPAGNVDAGALMCLWCHHRSGEISIMASEIERKFLVQGDGWRAGAQQRLCQCYLNRDKERTVRVRIAGDEAFLTIKGVTRGATRAEFEYEIPVQDAQQMLALSDGPILEKIRHVLVHEGSRWEVDEFLG